MVSGSRRLPPPWLFLVLAAGALISSGIYIGKMRMGDTTTGCLVSAVAFGALGVLLLFASRR